MGLAISALSFATLAKEVKNFGTLVAYDLKGHGFSKKEVGEGDFSIDTLNSEAIETLKELMQRYPEEECDCGGAFFGRVDWLSYS